MTDALLIAQREYLQRIRSKAFLFTTLAFPLLMAVIVGGGFFASSSGEAPGARTLVIASNDQQLAESVKANLESTGDPLYQVDVMAPVPAAAREELAHAVQSRRYDGLLWLDVEPGKIQPQAYYESRREAEGSSAALLENAIGLAVARRALAVQGLSQEAIAQAVQPVELQTIHLQSRGRSSLLSYAGPYMMALMLYFAVIYYGMNVARSVVQEKTSRVFEVLLATTRPQSLMAGKLLGVGAVGLTQIAIWVALGLLWAGSAVASSAMTGFAAAGKGSLATLGITFSQTAFFVLFFLLGFLFYSAVAAAFGACLDSEHEIQQFSFIIVLPMVACLVLTPFILDNPNGTTSIVLSLLPPCTPIVMFLRLSTQPTPAWQLWLSLVLMVASIWGVLWIAARIYRIGILMYGKRPTLPEIVRWLRYS